MALILDTGPLYAALDRNEPDHLICRRLIEGAQEEVVIPAPVLPEVDYHISTRLHPGILLALLDDILAGSFEIIELVPSDFLRIRQICGRYADSDVGFVDAAVLAVTERLNEPKLATFDKRHFGMMRPRHVDALHLLPD